MMQDIEQHIFGYASVTTQSMCIIQYLGQEEEDTGNVVADICNITRSF